MIDELVPDGVAAAEAFGDPAGGYLLPDEAALVAGAVEKRRREFTTGRHLARQALARLGVGPVPLLPGPRREPCWPDGIVGSITHCDGYRAAVAARSGVLRGVGIDAEPDQPLPAGVLDMVTLDPERQMLADLRRHRADVNWDRLLFCAKEAVYKTWYPLARTWLGFEDAVVTVDPGTGEFSARILVPGEAAGDSVRLEGFAGRWSARDGLLLAVITVPPDC